MKSKQNKERIIYVYADWQALACQTLIGKLYVAVSRGKEIFSFEYDNEWLQSECRFHLDPNLNFYKGKQYLQNDHSNFGLFLDSSPDRWGRVLMRRREGQMARDENREARTLLESDYLLGVYDENRMGALRFKLDPEAEFLDSNKALASPPWTQLRDLEYASLQLEKDDSNDTDQWLKMLIAPGASLGGARPKANVIDEKGNLWIAKFPSSHDDLNLGAWEYLVNQLAIKAKINVPEARIMRLSYKHDSFLVKRFDRVKKQRLHFASAMTMLGYRDGEEGASYLDLVDFLICQGAEVGKDLEELWRRVIFNICISNTDDHLRNHGFLLQEKGWVLSPAYDLNPCETANGLSLNISESDNSQDLDLAFAQRDHFRLSSKRAEIIMNEVLEAVKSWKRLAKKTFSSNEISRMERAFRFCI